MAGIAGLDAQAVPEQVRRQASQIARFLQDPSPDLGESTSGAAAIAANDDDRRLAIDSQNRGGSAQPAPDRAAVRDPHCREIQLRTRTRWKLKHDDRGLCLDEYAGQSPAAPAPPAAAASHADMSRDADMPILLRRKREVAQQRLALERMQDEMEAVYRDAVMMRLATEQLWYELRQDTPAEDLNRELSELREELDLQFRQREQRLANRFAELAEREAAVRGQQRHLQQEVQRLQEWADFHYRRLRRWAADQACGEICTSQVQLTPDPDHGAHRIIDPW
jgi:hypothetical protein